MLLSRQQRNVANAAAAFRVPESQATFFNEGFMTKSHDILEAKWGKPQHVWENFMTFAKVKAYVASIQQP